MSNLTEKDFQKMNIDQSFKAYKRDDLKLIYKVKLDNQEIYSKKRVITKILKFDENNQYGFGMTKPMPTGCIKETAFLVRFSHSFKNCWFRWFQWTSFYCWYMFWWKKNATKKQLLYNEIFPPIIEKQKTHDANERSAYQLLELFDTNKDKPKSYRCTAKSHVTSFPKNFILLYLEDLRFLIKRCSWKVTKI